MCRASLLLPPVSCRMLTAIFCCYVITLAGLYLDSVIDSRRNCWEGALGGLTPRGLMGAVV